MTGPRGTVRAHRNRRALLRGLALHLLAFLTLSSLLFVGRFGSWAAVGLSLVAPPCGVVVWASASDLGICLVSALVTLAPVAAALPALRSATRNRRLLLHAALLPYELWSLSLVGLGA